MDDFDGEGNIKQYKNLHPNVNQSVMYYDGLSFQ
jgi:hypothetical protein